MERYNKERSDGQTIIARFCLCGHAAVIVSADRAEHEQFDKDWKQGHCCSGHELIDFDAWIENILHPSLVTA
jgi:hypothetical protein